MSNFDWGLDEEKKKAILVERIDKLAKDGYSLELNYDFAVSLNQQEAVEKYKASVDAVQKSLEFHKKLLNELD